MTRQAILAALVVALSPVAVTSQTSAQTPAQTTAQAPVPTETGMNGASAVTLHLHPFLTPEELTVLRLVLTNDEALGLFVPERSGFAALAVSPEDGFVREGAVVPSAQALGKMADADQARNAALAACDARRNGTQPCVVVLDIAAGQ